jgi:hypothetical protein
MPYHRGGAVDTFVCPGEGSLCDGGKDSVQEHGECQQTFVCTHLLGETAGLGFNRNEPAGDNLFPDAWCDDCETIRLAHNGWTDESQALAEISLLCSGCYERARIRNTRPSITFDDLARLRWKCQTCEEWHTGPCLDFGFHEPYYWTEENEKANRRASGSPGRNKSRQRRTFLNEDYCAIDGNDFFVRGIIHLPIIGTAETFRWGVWGSLGRENFETLLKVDAGPKRIELPAMFSWLSTQIPEYPDTLNLKMYAHIQELDWRPHFELERTNHPLSREYHEGITPERVRKIMRRRLRGNRIRALK